MKYFLNDPALRASVKAFVNDPKQAFPRNADGMPTGLTQRQAVMLGVRIALDTIDSLAEASASDKAKLLLIIDAVVNPSQGRQQLESGDHPILGKSAGGKGGKSALELANEMIAQMGE